MAAMSEKHVTEVLEGSGFTEAQIDALLSVFTVHHHSHSIDEVIGLEEQLEEAGIECEEEDDDDE